MLDVLVAAGVLYGIYRLTAPPKQAPTPTPGGESGVSGEAPEEDIAEGVPPPYLGQECPYFGLPCVPRQGGGQCPALDAPCPYRGKSSRPEPDYGEGVSEEAPPTYHSAGKTPPETPSPPPNPFEERTLADEVAHLKDDGWNGSFDDVLEDDGPGDPYAPDDDEPTSEEEA